MKMGIDENRLKLIDVYANRITISCDILEDFKYPSLLKEAEEVLSKVTLAEMLRYSAEDVATILWRKYFDEIVNPLKEKYVIIKEILDAEPSLFDDEYYDAYCAIFDVFGATPSICGEYGYNPKQFPLDSMKYIAEEKADRYREKIKNAISHMGFSLDEFRYRWKCSDGFCDDNIFEGEKPCYDAMFAYVFSKVNTSNASKMNIDIDKEKKEISITIDNITYKYNVEKCTKDDD